MSAAPLDPNELPPEIKNGMIASLIGGFSMVARLLLSEEPVTMGWVVRRITAASIVAVVVGWGLQDQIPSRSTLFFCCGAAAYAAPEVTDAGMRWLKAKMKSEIKSVEIDEKKPKTKSRRKRK